MKKLCGNYNTEFKRTYLSKYNTNVRTEHAVLWAQGKLNIALYHAMNSLSLHFIMPVNTTYSAIISFNPSC